jgi:hypothetical protein
MTLEQGQHDEVLERRRRWRQERREQPMPESQQESARGERFELHFGKCHHCSSEHLVQRPGDDGSDVCPQRGWSMGPWGPSYGPNSRRRTF